VAGKHTDHQPYAGAGIAELEIVSGSASPPTPRPRTSQVVPTLLTGQPSARSALAV